MEKWYALSGIAIRDKPQQVPSPSQAVLANEDVAKVLVRSQAKVIGRCWVSRKTDTITTSFRPTEMPHTKMSLSYVLSSILSALNSQRAFGPTSQLA